MINTEIIKKYAPDKQNLLMILHDLQNNNPQQYITTEDIKEVSKYLKLSYSQVFGVATYYSMYSLKPRGRFIMRICNSPVCHMKGAEEVIEEVKKHLKLEVGETTPDGLFTLETTECLGRCSAAPSMILNEQFQGVLSPDRVKSIIEQIK
jgi:NADH:ubiquinone oxidoreductase subunit E